MRPLQLFLIAQWSMASQLLSFLVRLNEVFFHHLEWWENEHNLTCGVPLTSPKTSSTLCMDSSTMGWGATLDAGDSVSGTWTPQEAEESINFLEMMAIYLALSHLSSRLQRSDHPDSNRQLNLRIIPKTPGRHQAAPADLSHMEVVPSLHGSQHPVGSGCKI